MENNNNNLNLTTKVDKDVCIGCGTCTVIAPQDFEIDESGKATAKNSPKVADPSVVLQAAKSCPVSAIIVYDENRKQIYPVIK